MMLLRNLLAACYETKIPLNDSDETKVSEARIWKKEEFGL
jgi:hypothetical protein